MCSDPAHRDAGSSGSSHDGTAATTNRRCAAGDSSFHPPGCHTYSCGYACAYRYRCYRDSGGRAYAPGSSGPAAWRRPP